jgi:hypothetical protein
MRFTNIMRQIMAYMTLGTALWQVFSGDPDGEGDDEINVVSEIMNFAALLIVIEIDDFLMASPGQQWCAKFYSMRASDDEPDFLQFSFTKKDLRFLQNNEHLKRKRTCCEMITDIFESMMAYIFKIGVFIAIILVNLMILERFSITENI